MIKNSCERLSNLSQLFLPQPYRNRCALLECKDIIHKEIPERHNTRSDKLNEVEITYGTSVKQIYHKDIDSKTHKCKAQETQVLHHNMGVLTRECPQTIEYKVRCGRTGKAQRIGYIFIEFKELFGQICDTKIDNHSRTANDAELQEAFDKSLVL